MSPEYVIKKWQIFASQLTILLMKKKKIEHVTTYCDALSHLMGLRRCCGCDPSAQ